MTIGRGWDPCRSVREQNGGNPALPWYSAHLGKAADHKTPIGLPLGFCGSVQRESILSRLQSHAVGEVVAGGGSG